MPRKRCYTDSQIRRALIAYGEGKEFVDIATILGVQHFHRSTLIKERRLFGMTHGGGVPAPVYRFGIPEVEEPEALRRHRLVRRGFDLPRSLEEKFIDLLKSGLSIAEARVRLPV